MEDASEEALEDEEANDYSTYKAGLDEGVPPENDDSIESVAKDKREDVFDVANADNIMENNGDIECNTRPSTTFVSRRILWSVPVILIWSNAKFPHEQK